MIKTTIVEDIPSTTRKSTLIARLTSTVDALMAIHPVTEVLGDSLTNTPVRHQSDS